MNIRFNGIIEKRTSGCRPCGKQRGDSVFVSSKRYYLPSGATITFRAGQTAEVTDSDGEFLLTYRYTSPSGEQMKVFEEV